MKDFDRWNIRKQKLDSEEPVRQCHDGEVWVVAIGVNVGKEIDGKGEIFARPVLVLKRCNKDTFIGVSLTRTQKESGWYVPLVIDNIKGSVNISQIRLFDQRRLLRKIETIDPDNFKKIKNRINNLFITKSAPLRGPRDLLQDRNIFMLYEILQEVNAEFS